MQVRDPLRVRRLRPGVRVGRLTDSDVLPLVHVVAELAADEPADVLLRLLGRAADVRGEDHVGQAAQRGDERVAAALGLGREHVDRGAGDVARTRCASRSAS